MGTGFEFEPLSTLPVTPFARPVESSATLAEQIGQVCGLCAVIASAIPWAKFTSISANFWASTFENLPFMTISLKSLFQIPEIYYLYLYFFQ